MQPSRPRSFTRTTRSPPSHLLFLSRRASALSSHVVRISVANSAARISLFPRLKLELRPKASILRSRARPIPRETHSLLIKYSTTTTTTTSFLAVSTYSLNFTANFVVPPAGNFPGLMIYGRNWKLSFISRVCIRKTPPRSVLRIEHVLLLALALLVPLVSARFLCRGERAARGNIYERATMRLAPFRVLHRRKTTMVDNNDSTEEIPG